MQPLHQPHCMHCDETTESLKPITDKVDGLDWRLKTYNCSQLVATYHLQQLGYASLTFMQRAHGLVLVRAVGEVGNDLPSHVLLEASE